MCGEHIFAFIFQYVAPVIVIHRRETAHFLLNAARICVYSLSGYFTPALLSQAGMGKLIFLTN
jgi:sulfite exporter TauE/SafE